MNARIQTCSKFAFVAVALALLVSACDDNPADPGSSLFEEVQSSVFNQSCLSGCHSGEDPAAGLNLSEGAAYDEIVNVASVEVPELMRVEPGNSEDSYLYIKIVGGDRIAPGTLPMPIGRDLTAEQIGLVEEWIDSGAER